ncbi:MAG: AI-2E family transporter [Clostridium sp.]|uniref:AI-2E family transporter n=1 Tax=Clostridium sp. TaxID=1506 RepID=UPI002A879A98|nr:AI-2E family transporter [Clostridium sp.]MDY5098932.1 AI-2E family transporter [Clostridium sp.]
MKINWNTKYNTIAVYALLVTCGVCAFYLAISQLGAFTAKVGEVIGILQPFIIGFSLAYILNFLLKFYEDRILEMSFFKKLKLGSKRGLGLLFTYVTAFFLLYLFMHFVFPQVVESIVGLVNDIPLYIANLSDLFDKIVINLDIRDEYINMITTNFNEMSNYIVRLATNLLPVLGTLVTTIASSVWNIILGIIISIYLLIDKEKFFGMSKKIIYAVLSSRHAERTLELTRRSNSTFGKFLSGKILDSTIIGVLTFVILTVFKMPYTLLVSFIVAVTNIIPFFGPFIGAIPSVIIILFVSPIKALWFLLIIFVIQQIDGNIIGPKILGDSIGISAFWILFSIMVAGKFLGFVGMIIGVPLFAVIYSVVKENVEAKLEKKGLDTETKKYM